MTESKERQEVVKSNALVEASYRLSLYEQRILLAAITQVRRNEEVTDKQFYYVSATDIAEQTGVGIDAAYGYIWKAVERLYERRLTLFHHPNGVGPIKPKKGQKGMTTRWIQTIDHDAPLGCVGFRFSKDVLPYLSRLSREFTAYSLADVGPMTSAYAIRLYELLQQWSSVGTRTVSITWLREAFDLGDRHKAINDFKKIVVRPAVEQINKHSPLFVEWDQQKTGRRVTHLVFNFGPRSERKAAIERQAREAERRAAAAREQMRELMKKKKPWEDAEHPILPGEEKGDYFRRIAKIRGLDQPKSKPAAVATDSAAADQSRCTNTPDMFEAVEGESK